MAVSVLMVIVSILTQSNSTLVIIWAWAPGMDKFVLPKETGFKLGGNSTYRSAYIQLHYNNPNHDTDIYDNSTVRFTFTKTPRQYEAGVVIIGDNKFTLDPIPPQQEKVHYEMTCPSSCTQQLPHNITFFTDLLHMHAVGSEIYTTVTTKNNSFIVKNRIEFYEYNFQQNAPQNFVLQPGDQINLHCIFNTMSRNTNTSFGYGSFDEMCLDFAYYYPKVDNFRNCGYWKNKTSGLEYTQCNAQYSSVPTPPVKDSIDLTGILFGVSDPAYKCPASEETTSTTGKDEVNGASAVFASLYMIFVIVFVLVQ